MLSRYRSKTQSGERAQLSKAVKKVQRRASESPFPSWRGCYQRDATINATPGFKDISIMITNQS